MTEDNTTPMEETTGGSGDDSGLVKGLRVQIRDLQSELKSRPDRDSLWAEFQAEQQVNTAVEAALTSFGYPAGIRDTIKAKLGDGEVTREAVGQALASIGFNVNPDAVTGQGGEADQARKDLAQVSSLSGQVQAAAGSGSGPNILDRIANATSQEELRAIAAEGGFLATGR